MVRRSVIVIFNFHPFRNGNRRRRDDDDNGAPGPFVPVDCAYSATLKHRNRTDA